MQRRGVESALTAKDRVSNFNRHGEPFTNLTIRQPFGAVTVSLLHDAHGSRVYYVSLSPRLWVPPGLMNLSMVSKSVVYCFGDGRTWIASPIQSLVRSSFAICATEAAGPRDRVMRDVVGSAGVWERMPGAIRRVGLECG